MTYFLFCGKNWDYYFTRKNRDSELELFENVQFFKTAEGQDFIDRDYDDPSRFLNYA